MSRRRKRSRCGCASCSSSRELGELGVDELGQVHRIQLDQEPFEDEDSMEDEDKPFFWNRRS